MMAVVHQEVSAGLAKNRVVLLEPLARADLEAGLYTRGSSLEPFALECLASAAEARGYDVQIAYERERSVDDLVRFVHEWGPFCVGISVLTHTASVAREIARRIKQVLPATFVVVGGQHPSLCPEYVGYASFDYAVLGEGEVTFAELLDHLAAGAGNDPSAIAGIAYRAARSGRVVRTPPRERVSDLDGLAPPKRIPAAMARARCWNLSYPTPESQVAVAQVAYSRGCPHECAFCVSPHVWNHCHSVKMPAAKVTRRSPGAVAAEVKRLRDEFGVNLVYFTDLTFNEDLAKVRDLCNALIELGLHDENEMEPSHATRSVHWYALLKVGLDPETAALMARAGCSKIGVGVETFESGALVDFRKPPASFAVLQSSLHAADCAGLIVRCLLILGAPWETPESVETTIRVLRCLPVDQLRIAFLTPFPSTQIAAETSGHLLTSDFDLFDEDHPVIACDALSLSDLYDARSRIIRGFYQSPEYRSRCASKLSRFPWLRGSYRWFFADLFDRSHGDWDLRNLVVDTAPERSGVSLEEVVLT